MTDTNPWKFPTPFPSNSVISQPHGVLKKSLSTEVQPTSKIESPGLKPFSEPFGDFDLLQMTQ